MNIKEKLENWSNNKKKYDVKSLILKKRIQNGEMEIDGKTFVLIEEFSMDGYIYGFFINIVKYNDIAFLKSTIEEDGDEYWIPLDDDEEVDKVFDRCYKKYLSYGIYDEECEVEKYDEFFIRYEYKELTKLLIQKELTISTMESCTSGQIASLITDEEGSSAVLKGAFITYCNEAKIMQGVPKEILDKYTVYSKETACAMAEACKNTYKADIGIGVTGTMGNVDPANPEASIPGQVYFAISMNGEVKGYYTELPVQPSRLQYKLAVAKEVYDELVKLI